MCGQLNRDLDHLNHNPRLGNVVQDLYRAQILPKKDVLGHADCTATTRLQELDHTQLRHLSALKGLQ